MKKDIRICHFTSVHDANDDRIYLKECISLKDAGYKVYIVAKGKSKAENGIQIIGCGKPKNRAERVLLFSRRIYRQAKRLDCDIYHFHDPELLHYALKLKRCGKKVIFDSHEDIPAQILDKRWIPSVFRKVISDCYRIYETYVVKRIDAVVAATPHIGDQFKNRASKVVVINNYPKLDDIVFHDTPFEQREAVICYAGGIDEIRGEKVMVEAMKDLDGTLVLAGKAKGKMSGGGVKYLGHIDRNAVNELYGQAIAGLVLLQPTANYKNSLPIKMFEYMAAGIPFVASDFPVWREIVSSCQCGFCVPVDKKEKIRESIAYLLSNRKDAERMGRNGRRAVERLYNWKIESVKLRGLYESILFH